MKKKIALFANGWNGENLENFISGFDDVVGDSVDLFIFASYASYAVNITMIRAENAIYLMPDYSLFDAAIIFGSGLNSDESRDAIISKCKEADIPVVLQGGIVPGVPSVTVNNYLGMRDLCDHLIEKHGVKNTIYIAGPKDNEDSNIRLQALKDSLSAHNLTFDDENVFYANWEPTRAESFILEQYGDHSLKLPDAIVCANDPMALFVLKALQTANYDLPKDVIVTGFDDVNDGRIFYPSVCSVNQNYEDQGKACADILFKMFEGEKNETREVIKCIPSPGESCGCLNCKNESETRRMLGHNLLAMKFNGEAQRGRVATIELGIMSCEVYDMIASKIREEVFDRIGAEGNNFHIYINSKYKDLYYADSRTMDYSDEYFTPTMDVIAARTDSVVYSDETMDRKNLLLGYSNEGPGKRLVICPLRVDNAPIGYIVMDHNHGEFIDRKYIEFRGHISRAFEKYQSNINLYMLNGKLTKLNDQLTELMQTDALTGVKNRTAYEECMAKIDRRIADGNTDPVAVIMCDVNRLKSINDNMGHDAGDLYIKNCCEFLSKSFTNSPIFRTGGDEFVLVLDPLDYANKDSLIDGIEKEMEQLATSDIQPENKISIAIGFAEFDPTRDRSIQDTVKLADAYMYINKATSKARSLM